MNEGSDEQFKVVFIKPKHTARKLPNISYGVKLMLDNGITKEKGHHLVAIVDKNTLHGFITYKVKGIYGANASIKIKYIWVNKHWRGNLMFARKHKISLGAELINQALKKHKATKVTWYEPTPKRMALTDFGKRMEKAWLRRGNIKMTGKYSAEVIAPPELAITPPKPAPKKGFFKRLFHRR
ncbi:MAG: hypothetical protein V1676_02070 [Candidatus Diapherotrites archaeon]